MRTLIDGHLDLAWNGVAFDRDLTLELAELNAAEVAMEDGRWRSRATVSLPQLHRAGCAVAIVTLLARSGRQLTRQRAFGRTDLDYMTPLAAHAMAHAQWDWYNQLCRLGWLRWIRSREQLQGHWMHWHQTAEDQAGVRATGDELLPGDPGPAPQGPAAAPGNAGCWGGELATPRPTAGALNGRPSGQPPLGVVLSMEGADPILDPDDLVAWHAAGLRLLGPAHYGPSRFAQGTGGDGPLTPAGRELLKSMNQLGMALDVTHLSDTSMQEALELFDGRVLASHHNCRALVPGDRQLTDQQIRTLAQRDAVIGLALDAWMLFPGWERGRTPTEVVSLAAVVDHADRICQITGSVRHLALGSDLDGGFGTEQTPHDLRSIADLQQLDPLLAERGYSADDRDAIFHGNWFRLLSEVLPG